MRISFSTVQFGMMLPIVYSQANFPAGIVGPGDLPPGLVSGSNGGQFGPQQFAPPQQAGPQQAGPQQFNPNGPQQQFNPNVQGPNGQGQSGPQQFAPPQQAGPQQFNPNGPQQFRPPQQAGPQQFNPNGPQQFRPPQQAGPQRPAQPSLNNPSGAGNNFAPIENILPVENSTPLESADQQSLEALPQQIEDDILFDDETSGTGENNGTCSLGWFSNGCDSGRACGTHNGHDLVCMNDQCVCSNALENDCTLAVDGTAGWLAECNSTAPCVEGQAAYDQCNQAIACVVKNEFFSQCHTCDSCKETAGFNCDTVCEAANPAPNTVIDPTASGTDKINADTKKAIADKTDPTPAPEPSIASSVQIHTAVMIMTIGYLVL